MVIGMSTFGASGPALHSEVPLDEAFGTEAIVFLCVRFVSKVLQQEGLDKTQKVSEGPRRS